MDEFSRSLLPAAAESGLSLSTVSRHRPVLCRNVAESDTVLVAAPCVRADRPWQHDLVLIITAWRLVATRESRFLHWIRPHVDTPVSSLVNVTWMPDPDASAVDLAFTLTDTRHRLLISAVDRHQVWRIDAVFGRIFLQPVRLAF